jgi:hypothetical protein
MGEDKKRAADRTKFSLKVGKSVLIAWGCFRISDYSEKRR